MLKTVLVLLSQAQLRKQIKNIQAEFSNTNFTNNWYYGKLVPSDGFGDGSIEFRVTFKLLGGHY